MRIGIDLLYLRRQQDGVGVYAEGLLRGLRDMDTTNHYVLFVSREADLSMLPLSSGWDVVVCPFSGSRALVRYLWQQLMLPLQLWRYRVETVHSLCYVGPLFGPFRKIVTIHDMNLRVLRADMSLARRVGLGFFSGWSAKNCDVVVTVSQFSKREILRAYGLPRNKVAVVYSGPGLLPEGLPGEPPANCGRENTGDQPYVCAIGGRYRHKNLARLFHAFAEVARDLPHQLVVIGELHQEARQALAGLGPLRNRIRQVGFLPKWDVLRLMAGADLFVFPSLYEGFGFPVLEAQGCQTAVACSHAAALPEIAGSGAAYFDPYDVVDMARVIVRCLKDRHLRDELIAKGTRNVRRFSWRTCAQSHLRLYRGEPVE